MQKTFEARLLLDAAQAVAFDAWGARYGQLKRTLYQWVASRGGQCKDFKVEFCTKFGMTARQFNALAIELQGAIDSTKELLKMKKSELEKKLKSNQARLKRVKATAAKINAGLLKITNKKRCESHTRAVTQLPMKVKDIQMRLTRIKARLKQNVPGICFGTKKLFQAQYHLEDNGFDTHAQWLLAWRKARSHQFFFVGSKDETGGNQSCVASVVARDATVSGVRDKAACREIGQTYRGDNNQAALLRLRIRRPDVLSSGHVKRSEGQNTQAVAKYLEVDVVLKYGREAVLAAMDAGRALSYRFHRDNDNDVWYVQIMVDVPATQKISRQKGYGVLGIDFNVDHLAVTQTNLHGNFVKSWTVPLELEGKTTAQRENILSEALKSVVDYAQVEKLPIAVEDLDFSAKKAFMERKSKRYRVMLSGLMYAKYQQFIESKCAKEGLELTRVNPAYTSLIGRLKYAKPYGLSVHGAAAGVIARRAQGWRETLKPKTPVVLASSVCTFEPPVRKAESERTALRWYDSQMRKTLYELTRAQSRRDKLRFKSGGTVGTS